MIYVLIVLWWPASSQSGKQIAMHDFNTPQACEAAKRLVLSSEKASSDSSTLLRAYCTPKG